MEAIIINTIIHLNIQTSIIFRKYLMSTYYKQGKEHKRVKKRDTVPALTKFTV